MASEYAMTLKATLDTADVQQKLGQLNQQSQSVNEATAASKDINTLSESLKGLRKAVGGGAMVHAIGDFTRELNLLGDSTESTVRQFVGSFNTLFAALGTGNPTIVAIVGAIELFSTTSGLFKKSLDDMVKASQDALKNLEDRVKKAKEFRGNVEKWESEQAEEALLGSGDENALRKKYFEQQIRREQIARDLAYEKQMAGTVGWDEQAANRLVEEDKNLAASIKRIQEVLKRSYLGKQMTEQAGFTEKKEEHEKNEKERQSYIDFLIELQNQKDQMEEKRVEMQEEFDSKKPKIDYMQVLRMLGGQTSGFSSTGFGMGEVSVTTTISRQIDEVIRLLQDQLRKDLTVVNTNDLTI